MIYVIIVIGIVAVAILALSVIPALLWRWRNMQARLEYLENTLEHVDAVLAKKDNMYLELINKKAQAHSKELDVWKRAYGLKLQRLGSANKGLKRFEDDINAAIKRNLASLLDLTSTDDECCSADMPKQDES